ncbi:unnamed protein product [Rotaria sp. Silwood2]|nr:unnamed protein product [Rotaria sp. Silwood2]CAF4502494.1 unnamed protein product [Rotaria sp. Silwood2]
MNEFNSTFDNRKHLILTGHSLGGGVAHVCAIFSLANRSFKENPPIYSIAFGAPFIGNSIVAKDLIKNNFNKHFLTIIHQNDIVPNLLNLVETGTRIQSTIASIIEPHSEITKTLLSLITLATGVPPNVLSTSIETLNRWMPKLESLLKKKITEYKPIGQYGFISSSLSLNNWNNQEDFKWIITYQSNKMKIDHENKDTFIDIILKRLIESCGSLTETITDINIINRRMEKYISSLKSCEIIHCQSSTYMRKAQQDITEFKRFNPFIRKATAIYSDRNIKIIITGDHLDFLSSHKKMCTITSFNRILL